MTLRFWHCFALLLLSLSSLSGVAWAGDGVKPRNLFYDETLFDFFQQEYFTAIPRLLAAQKQARLGEWEDEAELLLGGLYLSYGLHQNAREIFDHLLNSDVDVEVRNRAWFYLAKIEYQRGYLLEADEVLAKIDGPLRGTLQEQRIMLEAQLLSRRDAYEEAVIRLQALDSDNPWSAFANYNLAITLIRLGHKTEGVELLEQLTKLDEEGDKERTALIDKSLIALGYTALQNKQFAQARSWFKQASLQGIFSTQALLGLGWAEFGLGNYRSALSPWFELQRRDRSDPAVLEAFLAVPYTFDQLAASGQAGKYYELAIGAFSGEADGLQHAIETLDFSEMIGSILQKNPGGGTGWHWQADIMPNSIMGRYIYRMLARNEFQEALKSYRDLLSVSANLEDWSHRMERYQTMLTTRRDAFDQQQAETLEILQQLDSNQLDKRLQSYQQQVAQIEANDDALALATEAEMELLDIDKRIEKRLQRLEGQIDTAHYRFKHRIFKGQLIWQTADEFGPRLWQVEKKLNIIEKNLAEAQVRRASLAGLLRQIPKDFVSQQQRLDAYLERITAIQVSAKKISGLYETHLQAQAKEELQRLLQQVKAFQAQAIFAVAQLYDRSAHTQSKEVQ